MKRRRISYREWLAPPRPVDESGPVPRAEAPAIEPTPAVAAAPVEPVATVEPVVAAEPVAAVEPVMAVEPVVTVEPVAGVEPAVAAEPIATVEPAEPPPVEYLTFRVGRELFALPLDAVDEALDVGQVQRMPESGGAMLGVMTVRGTTVPLYAPAGPLGVTGDSHRTALVFLSTRGRVALAVDDVDDVLVISSGEIHRPPLDFGDRMLVGVARRDADLVGLLDADALVAACRAEPVLETA